ncbi:MAG: hypothetical protein K2P71_02780 [Lachnospiraceae bacterium]|jgi:ATP-dependent DNA helicase RecG|nr:hypothetical protein [Lachnospiraceae bacterium]
MVDVNLLSEDGLDYIELVVNPWSFPVNYNSGKCIEKFLMTKTGLKRDAETISNIGVDNLDQESTDIFRREVLRSGRMTKEDLESLNV